MPFSYHTKAGDRFGSRVIVGFLRRRDTDGHRICRWKCDCGAKGVAGLKGLRHTLNCTNCRPSNVRGNPPVHGHSVRGARTHLYDCWANMMQRTRGTGSPRNKRWYAGITVCPAWQTFDGFRQWAEANGYRKGLSLDRVYTNRNYEPANCEWVTRAENTRRAFEKWRNYDSTPIEMLWGST